MIEIEKRTKKIAREVTCMGSLLIDRILFNQSNNHVRFLFLVLFELGDYLVNFGRWSLCDNYY